MGLGVAKAIRDSNVERRGIISLIGNINDKISKYTDDMGLARSIITGLSSLIPGGPLVKMAITGGLESVWWNTAGKKHREEIDELKGQISDTKGTGTDGSAKFHIGERETQVDDVTMAMSNMEREANKMLAMDVGAAAVQGLEHKKRTGGTSADVLLADTDKGGYGMDVKDVEAGYTHVGDASDITDATTGKKIGESFDVYKSGFAESFFEGTNILSPKKTMYDRTMDMAKNEDWEWLFPNKGSNVSEWFGGSTNVEILDD